MKIDQHKNSTEPHWDVKHLNRIKLSDVEWALVQEGLEDYMNGNVIFLEEFINKRAIKRKPTS